MGFTRWAVLKGARNNNADALCSIGLNLMSHSIHLVPGLFWAMHSIHYGSNAFNHSTPARVI